MKDAVLGMIAGFALVGVAVLVYPPHAVKWEGDRDTVKLWACGFLPGDTALSCADFDKVRALLDAEEEAPDESGGLPTFQPEPQTDLLEL